MALKVWTFAMELLMSVVTRYQLAFCNRRSDRWL